MFAYIKFIHDPRHPDQGLPPGEPGEPVAPDQGLPGEPATPTHPIYGFRPRPWPPLPWPPRPWPPTPVDPDWGLDAGVAPGQPIYLPIGPDQGLPPVGGHEPPTDPPPGTVWPPIPGAPEGKAAILVWIIGVGYRYFVVELPPPEASQLPVPVPAPPEASQNPVPVPAPTA
jgi:hypothetical protein